MLPFFTLAGSPLVMLSFFKLSDSALTSRHARMRALLLFCSHTVRWCSWLIDLSRARALSLYTGCGLDLVTFVKTVPFALILCLTRAVCIFVASLASGTLMKEQKRQNVTIWMTLLAQGGFDLGLGAQVADVFPGWGDKFKSIIVACVVIHQIVGPVLCKLALKWSGEAGLASGMEALEEKESDPNAEHTADSNRCVILGTTSSSKALAMNLLKEHWGVTMLTLDDQEASSLQEDIKEWADYTRSEQTTHAQMFDLGPPVFPIVPLEDNFQAKPVPVEGSKHPFLRRAGSESDLHSAVIMHSQLGHSESPTDVTTRQAQVGGNLPVGGPDEAAADEIESLDGDWEARLVRVRPSFDKRCQSLLHTLEGLTGVKVIVLALNDDLAALSLLDTIQEHMRRLKSSHSSMLLLPRPEVRYVVLMQELRWAETFSMLDAIPVHDFVSNLKTTMLATTTAFSQDCTLVNGQKTSSLETMSDAFLGLFDGPLLAKCAPDGQRLHDLSDAKTLSVTPTMKLLEILQRKMKLRKTFLTGGRMLHTIDEMIQKSLNNLDATEEDASNGAPHNRVVAREFSNISNGVPHNRVVRGAYSDLEAQAHGSTRTRMQSYSTSYEAVALGLPSHTSPFTRPQNASRGISPSASFSGTGLQLNSIQVSTPVEPRRDVM